MSSGMSNPDLSAFFEGDEGPGSPCGGCALKSSPGDCSCGSTASRTDGGSTGPSVHLDRNDRLANKEVSRRDMLKMMGVGGLLSGRMLSSLNPTNWMLGGPDLEKTTIDWQEFFKSNYRVMSERERRRTIERLERRYELEHGGDRINIQKTDARRGVLYGYAFNISKCRGYRDCVRGCIEENNLDRGSNMQYIRIFEKRHGSMDLEGGEAEYFHRVPAEGHFYIGTQCYQCENPPCVEVCPVGATWKEPDGIVVIDYDWCIGCRYCQAACPYWARRFNWSQPRVPEGDINPDQHYLGNRPRDRGEMEKCTFCIQRSRRGELPACVEACPTGARTFGNLLDPSSEIRYILENKKVFRLKEDLNTEPKFWYYMD